MLGTPLVVSFAVCGLSSPSCSCDEREPLTNRAAVAAAVDEHAAVFEGTVVRTEPHLAFGGGGPSMLEVTVSVNRRWKGAPADTMTVRTPGGSPACDFPFAEGRTYLVFARACDEESSSS